MRAAILILVCGIGGCVTPLGNKEDDNGAQLIERSKESDPAWIDMESGRLHETDLQLQFVHIKPEQAKLSTAIKDTQLEAMVSSQLAVQDQMRGRIKEFAQSNSVDVDGVQLDKAVEESAQSVYRKYARIGDIYFEKYRYSSASGTQISYYKTYVLVQYPVGKLGEIYGDLADRVRRSSQPEMRRLQDLIQKMAEAPLSH